MENVNLLAGIFQPFIHIIIIVVLILVAKNNWDKDPRKVVSAQGALNKDKNFIIAIASAVLAPTTGIPYLVLLMNFNNAKNAQLARILRILSIIGISIILLGIIAFIIFFGTCLAMLGGASLMGR